MITGILILMIVLLILIVCMMYSQIEMTMWLKNIHYRNAEKYRMLYEKERNRNGN